jgi:cytochrome c556
MLSGSAAYDQAALRQAVQIYVTDGTMLASRITGNSAEARDFAARFHAIAADGQAALHAVADPARFRSRFARITDDCRSCHAIYNN